jgi:hypothetical protein
MKPPVQLSYINKNVLNKENHLMCGIIGGKTD